jgi:hypothetical protein
MRGLSWKVYPWARTGKAQAGQASDQAHTTTLVQEEAEASLFSSYPVAELRMMLNRESRSPRPFDSATLSQ